MPNARPFLHAVFLARIGSEDLTDTNSRRGQAAFLTLRVVDLLAQPRQEVEQVFEYQRKATTRYVTELEGQEHPEIVRLRAILDSCTPNKLSLLLRALRDYAEYLEVVGLLQESADVFATLLDVGIGREPAGEWIETLQQLVKTLVLLKREDEAEAVHKRAMGALRGVTDKGVRVRAQLARLELMVARGDLTGLDRAARRCWMSAERAGDPAVRWNATTTLSRIFLNAKTPIPAALVLEGIRTSDRPAPSPAAGLDYAEAHMRLGSLTLAKTALDEGLMGDVGDTLRLRAGRMKLELSARMGDELGLARGLKELEPLLDPAVVASLRCLLEDAEKGM